MRLKTTIINPRVLCKLIQALEKISKSCVLKFTTTRLQCIIKDPTDTGIRVYGQFPSNAIFENYTVESSHGLNEIWIQVEVSELSRALKSTLSAHTAQLKLAKSAQGPVLAILVGAESKSALPLSIEQRVHINVLRKAQTIELREPRVPSPDVYIMLPHLSTLREMSERMQRLTSRVVLMANFEGKFRMKCGSSTAEIDIEYRDLINPRPAEVMNEQVESEQLRSTNPEKWHSLTIDSKDLARILHCQVANPSHVVCCIHAGICASFYVYITDPLERESDENEIVLTYYVPGKID